MELIWSQPSFKYVNEPLNLKSGWMQKASGIRGFSELYTREAKEKVVDYFYGFSSGRRHFLDPNPLRKHYRPFTRRIVFKVIHGGELFINDISRACNGRVIYLMRHPIAVALSRKQLPRMDELCSDLVLGHFTPEERNFALSVKAKGDPMELRILAWCLQNKLALQQRTTEWMVVTYEQLVMDPPTVVEKLAVHAQLPAKERIYKQLNTPSAVSVQSEEETITMMEAQERERLKLVDVWKNRVDDSRAMELMEICTKMNIRVYHRDGFPAKEWLV